MYKDDRQICDKFELEGYYLGSLTGWNSESRLLSLSIQSKDTARMFSTYDSSEKHSAPVANVYSTVSWHPLYRLLSNFILRLLMSVYIFIE